MTREEKRVEVEQLARGYVDGKLPDEITISWHYTDVKEIAPDFSDDQCREVLQIARNNHDATIGVNWDVLEVWADKVRNEDV